MNDAGIEAQREAYVVMNRQFNSPCPSALPRLDETQQIGVQRITIRRYRPQQVLASRRILFIHGGGWYFGDPENHDFFASQLAHDCRSELISVDYRRATEAPFPAALDDVYSVY